MTHDSDAQEQMPDGTWRPSCPEPLWVGWRLRTAQCSCGAKFRGHRWWVLGKATARELYREHWYAMLAAIDRRKRGLPA